MRQPYQKYFAASIIQPMIYPDTIQGDGPILETLEEIALDSFFTAVEVGQINDPQTRKEAAELLKQAHLRVGFGAQPMLLMNDLSLNSPVAKERKGAIDQMKKGIDQAYELGAERLCLLSGPTPEDPSQKDEQINLLTDSMHQICEYSENKGDMGITLEVFDETIDKKALIGDDYSQAARFAEEVKRAGHDFGLLVDLSHLPMQGARPMQALSEVRDHLVHAHVGNCVISDKDHPAYGDLHPRFGIESGENDVPELVEYLEALFKIGFLGGEEKPFLGIEVSPLKNESPQVIAANAKRAFNKAWAQLEI